MKLGREIAKDLTQAKKPRNKKELLVASGYSESTATQSSAVIFKQEGTINAVNVALEQAGFTEEVAKRVVAEILEDETNEPRDRLKAADMVFQVRGTYAPDKSISMNVNTEDLRKAVLEDLSRFRGSTKP